MTIKLARCRPSWLFLRNTQFETRHQNLESMIIYCLKVNRFTRTARLFVDSSFFAKILVSTVFCSTILDRNSVQLSVSKPEKVVWQCSLNSRGDDLKVSC